MSWEQKQYFLLFFPPRPRKWLGYLRETLLARSPSFVTSIPLIKCSPGSLSECCQLMVYPRRFITKNHNWLRLNSRQTIITQLRSRENYIAKHIAPGLPSFPSHWCGGFKWVSDSWHDLQLVCISVLTFLPNPTCPICCYLGYIPKELFD